MKTVALDEFLAGKRAGPIPRGQLCHRGQPMAPTYHGLNFYDGCGARLDPRDQLAGLCEECRGPKATGAIPNPPPRRDR